MVMNQERVLCFCRRLGEGKEAAWWRYEDRKGTEIEICDRDLAATFILFLRSRNILNLRDYIWRSSEVAHAIWQSPKIHRNLAAAGV
ncbi:hypothetical protein ACS0TY_010447 [Phlomoides rotata]